MTTKPLPVVSIKITTPIEDEGMVAQYSMTCYNERSSHQVISQPSLVIDFG